MARTQELFSIGDVAQLFHLSVSSLRHYETIGLLTPEYTDPATGYRYYGPRQFEVLNTIRYLRALVQRIIGIIGQLPGAIVQNELQVAHRQGGHIVAGLVGQTLCRVQAAGGLA